MQIDHIKRLSFGLLAVVNTHSHISNLSNAAAPRSLSRCTDFSRYFCIVSLILVNATGIAKMYGNSPSRHINRYSACMRAIPLACVHLIGCLRWILTKSNSVSICTARFDGRHSAKLVLNITESLFHQIQRLIFYALLWQTTYLKPCAPGLARLLSFFGSFRRLLFFPLPLLLLNLPWKTNQQLHKSTQVAYETERRIEKM